MTPLTMPTPEAALTGMDTFLRLLTAQLRNQDPLSPMEGTAFAQQLATFSNVEQQIKTGQRLEEIAESLSHTRFTDAAGLVGQEVSVAVTSARFDGITPMDMQAELPKEIKAGVVVVRSSDGSAIARIPVASDGAIHWDGKLADGTIAPVATYSVEARALLEDGRLGAAGEVRMDRRIGSVELSANGSQFLGEDGLVIDLRQVRQIK